MTTFTKTDETEKERETPMTHPQRQAFHNTLTVGVRFRGDRPPVGI